MNGGEISGSAAVTTITHGIWDGTGAALSQGGVYVLHQLAVFQEARVNLTRPD